MEKLFEVVTIFVDVGLAVPSLVGILEDSCIVQDVVPGDYDLGADVRTMIFEELHTISDNF